MSTDYILGNTSSEISPKVFDDEFVNGITFGEVLKWLGSFSQDDRNAVYNVIDAMRTRSDKKKTPSQMPKYFLRVHTSQPLNSFFPCLNSNIRAYPRELRFPQDTLKKRHQPMTQCQGILL